MTTIIGELKGIEDGIKVEWEIPNFFTFTTVTNEKYHSPTFAFAGAIWYLRIIPNSITDNTEGRVKIYIMKDDLGPSVTFRYEIGLKKTDGNIDKDCSYTNTFNGLEGMGCSNFISVSQLYSRKSELAPFNVVTVICKLVQREPNFNLSPPFRKANKLSKDLRELMLKGNGSDLTIKIGEKEFKLHKVILGIRCPAFATTVKKEMETNESDTVNLHDYEEDIFTKFLEYIYTGDVNDLKENNLFGLYEIAAKYEVTELKDDCLTSIKDNLSVNTFFDAVNLAEKYDEEELKPLISKFCSDNLIDLVKNPKWIIFMQENAKKAYELLSTALTNYVKS